MPCRIHVLFMQGLTAVVKAMNPTEHYNITAPQCHFVQTQLEEEEMEKMRLGAALATLRADMEAVSAAQATAPPGTPYSASSVAVVPCIGVRPLSCKRHASQKPWTAYLRYQADRSQLREDACV